MNRTDRLYAIVEELRAVAPRPRSARWLAARFEVSARTVERDIGALQQSGVPIYAQPGRVGGYTLDPARTLPPVNITAGEAVAIAVALRRLDGTPFAQAAGSALQKLLAVMPPADVNRADELARRCAAGVPVRPGVGRAAHRRGGAAAHGGARRLRRTRRMGDPAHSPRRGNTDRTVSRRHPSLALSPAGPAGPTGGDPTCPR
jgi:biotin operon repressor